MANLSIKDVPEAWAQALRQRAARNHRSLQGELMAIVEQAIAATPATATASPEDRARPRIVGYDQAGYPIVRQGWKTVEQIAADLRARYPDPINSGPSSIGIIREDRDSR
jgi:plasmid stability protein